MTPSKTRPKTAILDVSKMHSVTIFGNNWMHIDRSKEMLLSRLKDTRVKSDTDDEDDDYMWLEEPKAYEYRRHTFVMEDKAFAQYQNAIALKDTPFELDGHTLIERMRQCPIRFVGEKGYYMGSFYSYGINAEIIADGQTKRIKREEDFNKPNCLAESRDYTREHWAKTGKDRIVFARTLYSDLGDLNSTGVNQTLYKNGTMECYFDAHKFRPIDMDTTPEEYLADHAENDEGNGPRSGEGIFYPYPGFDQLSFRQNGDDIVLVKTMKTTRPPWCPAGTDQTVEINKRLSKYVAPWDEGNEDFITEANARIKESFAQPVEDISQLDGICFAAHAARDGYAHYARYLKNPYLKVPKNC